MKKANLFIIFGLIVCFMTLSACVKSNQDEIASETEIPKPTETNIEPLYNNPIDEYFIPKIESAESEASRREFQDIYKTVWESEFKNLIKWIKRKCVYDEDEKNVLAMEKGVYENIDNAEKVFLTEITDAYNVNPNPKKAEVFTRLSLRGNGTRSRLNQIIGEIYRDNSIRIISVFTSYKFLERDYSETH